MASKTVDEYPDCERCPNRIFNTGKYIQGGRGSIHGDIVFLFPKGDRVYCDDYQLFTDIGNLYDEYSGRNNTEDVYMTYSIKCACSNNYNTYLTAVDKCRNILWKELARINYKYLFIFGDAYRSISDNPIPRFIATGGKYVFSNYSPLIKFKDNNLYHVFKQRFADDINWVNENRNNYVINFINDFLCFVGMFYRKNSLIFCNKIYNNILQCEYLYALPQYSGVEILGRQRGAMKDIIINSVFKDFIL